MHSSVSQPKYLSQYDGYFKRWGSISRFYGCYVRYCLHYGFKISMLLKYDLLLVTTYINCQLNIIVVLNDMTLYHAFKQIKIFCYY